MSLDMHMSFSTYEDVERFVGQELAKELENRLYGVPVQVADEPARVKSKPAKRRTRSPRRREILRDRKAQLSLAKSATPSRMTWSGKGGTFTLGLGGPAIEVKDWSIETNEPNVSSCPVGVGVLKVKSSPFKIYRPEAN